jgi:glucose dehydrogenase
MLSRRHCLYAALALAASFGAGTAPAAPPGDWPMYSHDHAGTRFSALKEIDRANVGALT